MERRMRPRVTPMKNVLAVLNYSSHSANVVDYSVAGLRVVTTNNRLKPGNQVVVDLIVNEKLCACCIPGTVCWTRDSLAGIRLTHSREDQIQGCSNIETCLMC